MRKLIFILLTLSFITLQAQDNSRNVIISKVTADWCPNCGTWGWSFFEELKDEFSDGSAILLGVHHSGGLKNPVSDWFSTNLGNTYQPQFFINNNRFNVLASNWQQKVEEIKDEVAIIKNESAGAILSFNDTYIDNNATIITSVNVTPDNLATGDYYFGIYIFENDVIWQQASRGSSAKHPFVLRDVMADEYFGDSYIPGMNPSGTTTIEKSFKIEDSSWVHNNLGLLSILWKKQNNKYVVENTEVIYDIGLLSSNINLLDQPSLIITNNQGILEIRLDETNPYECMIYNQQGQLVHKNIIQEFARVITTDYSDGIYIVTVRSKDMILSKQVFINKH